MDLQGKRLLILGGSRITCEIVRQARKMGIVTGVTDWYSLEKSPAKQLADEAYYENTSDIVAIAKLVREQHFDGVLTGFTDSVLPYYAEICECVGLPSYGTKEQFDIFINKQKYKKLLRKFSIPTIPEYSITLENFGEKSTDIEYPVLVKPADGSGSKGITICHNSKELKEAIELAVKNSKTKEMLVEKYVDSQEATIFWVFIEGEYYMMLLGNRHIKYNQEGVLPLPVGYTYPASVMPRFLKDTAPKMKEMFRSVGIKNGMMFMQCKIVEGECLVYDIGYRLTGSLEYINLEGICGYNPLNMLINFALTGKMGEKEISKRIDPYLCGKYSYNVSLLSKPGKIAEIHGVEQVKKLPGVLDVVLAHPVGDVITEDMKGRLSQITIRVLGKADSIEQMKDEMLEIHRCVHVISDKGEELLLPGMEASDYGKEIYKFE